MTKNLATDRLPRTWAELLSRFPKHVVSDEERDAIDGHLLLAGVSAADRVWMTPSCPSLATAERLYPICDATVAVLIERWTKKP